MNAIETAGGIKMVVTDGEVIERNSHDQPFVS